MKTFEFTVDKDGLLRSRGIHDATMQAFRYTEHEHFEMCLRGTDEQSRWFSLNKISQLGLENVVNGLIVSDIYCWQLSDPAVTLANTSDAWRVLFGGNCREDDLPQAVNKLKKRYSNEQLILVDSSYGGMVAAICKELKISGV